MYVFKYVIYTYKKIICHVTKLKIHPMGTFNCQITFTLFEIFNELQESKNLPPSYYFFI